MIQQTRERVDQVQAEIDGLPELLRTGAAFGGTTPSFSPLACVHLARRIERPAPIIILTPPTELERRADEFGHRLCACMFLSIAAVVATEAALDLIALLS